MDRLSEVTSGSSTIFISVDSGFGAEKRLAEMGLLPGEEIRVIHNTGFGPVTVSIKGSRLAIGHGLARKILVRRIKW